MSWRRTDSEVIAAFAADFDSARLDDRHIRQCGRALADTMAVAIAARGEPAVHRAYRYIDSLAPRLIDGRGTSQPSTASLWGWQQASTVEGAALFNGIAGHVLDFDDASSPMSGHPSVALLPALVALAEARGTAGIRLISAYIVGFEICCKLGRALDVTHYARGWHMTPTIGTIAAAAACGHLLDLDSGQIVHAIGLAIAQTAGTRENFGTDAKSFQAGQLNAAAIRAALLAEQGFTASPHSLDGKAGYMALYSSGEDISPVLETLGTLPLEIDSSGIEIKKYPACYGIHRPLDGLFDIMTEHRFGLADIKRVEIRTSYGMLAPLVRHPPRSGTEGKFSMEYSIAAATADRGIRLSSYTDEAVSRPEITSRLERIVVTEATGRIIPRWASLSITFRDGQVRARHVDDLKGSPRFPLSDEAIFAKISDCLSWGNSGIDPDALLNAVSRLGTMSVRELLAAIEQPVASEKRV